MTTATVQTMPMLFKRLKKIGLDKAFLCSQVLPDWWDDSLAENPGTRTQIQLHLANRLGLPVADIADTTKELRFPDTSHIRLKRAKKDSDREAIAPAMFVTVNSIRPILAELQDVPPMPANLTAAAFRNWVLERNGTVDLAGLVEACWASGIAVFHFHPLPKGSKKFAGMAYYEGTRPVIVLGTGYDAPPRLAFYLAHEISHVIRGHVKPGEGILADTSLLGSGTEDKQEIEADGDALEMLTGDRKPEFDPIYGLTAPKLAAASRGYEERTGVHAGTAALVYGKTAQRMPVAMAALTWMNMGSGARQILAEGLKRRLPDVAELPGGILEILPVFGVNHGSPE
jgi:hypothetical protein